MCQHQHSTRLLSLLFNASWLAIRVLWFPYVAVQIVFFAGGWPAGWMGHARHAVVGACTTALALLQLQWTRDALWPKPKEKEEGAEEGGKGGFL